jgi:apolipoprotein D and lipocalin family protein
MSVPSASIPQPPELSLDERIRRAELRLIAREDSLKRRINRLGERVHEALQPRRYIVPAIGVAVVLSTLWLMLRRRARPLPAHTAWAGTAAAPSGELPWVHVLAMLWPLLPGGWRGRISPATAATLVSVGLPLAERLLGPRTYRPLPTVPHVDLARYAGTWHEIAHLPPPLDVAGDAPSSTDYTLREDAIEVLQRRRARDGHERVSRGVARVVPDSGNARLQVSMLPRALRWLPFAWSERWVLHVDDDYQCALVGHPDRRHLWLLSRTPQMHAEPLAALVQLAAELEFPVERLKALEPA